MNNTHVLELNPSHTHAYTYDGRLLLGENIPYADGNGKYHAVKVIDFPGNRKISHYVVDGNGEKISDEQLVKEIPFRANMDDILKAYFREFLGIRIFVKHVG